MTSAELLADSFARIREVVHHVLAGLTSEQLTARVDSDANSIGWLIWHLTRIQDDHVAGVAGTEQVWMSEGWVDRFNLPLEPSDHGYGHSSEQVAMVVVDADLLRQYYDAVHDATLAFIAGLTDDDLDRVVDDRWDPPVTLGVRLVSVIHDDVTHTGQAAFIRGILER
jgi:uncharacterized damage-inducible protein DinB